MGKKKIELVLQRKCKRLLELQNELSICEEEIKNAKKEIIDIMSKGKIDSFFLSDEENEEIKIKITKVKTGRVSYDIPKLKNKLNKKQKKELIKRKITIENFDEFSKVMKERGIKPNEIINLLSIEEKVDTNKLKNMYEIGEIDLVEINDCFTLSQNEYLKVKEIEEER